MRHKHNGINTFSAGSRQMLHNKEGLCWTLFSAWRSLFSCSALTFNLWNKYLQSPHADLHTCAFIKTTLISHSIRIQNTEQHQYTACALENKLTVSTSWFSINIQHISAFWQHSGYILYLDIYSMDLLWMV